jgi:serine kinase of HPr protein (carbohydrate metabolism regulator)
MKVKDIVSQLNFEVVTGDEGLDKEVGGVYINDLLSFVMSHGKKDDIWITVQIHPNIIAVASLLDFSCIIIPENLNIEEVTLERANKECITVLRTKLTGYEICRKLNEIGI